jgi:hypothetical protein
MLTITKQTALNLILRFEIAIMDLLQQEKEPVDYSKRLDYNNRINILNRNIQSIKKQFKKL